MRCVIDRSFERWKKRDNELQQQMRDESAERRNQIWVKVQAQKQRGSECQQK